MNTPGFIIFQKQNNNFGTHFKKWTFTNSSRGEKDCIPEFQFNWISPEAPAIRWVIPTPVQPTIPVPPPQPLVAPPVAPPVALPVAPPQALPQQQQIALQVQQEPLPDQQPVSPAQVPAAAVLPEQKVEVSTRVLRDKVPIDYKELHTGVKKKCHSLQRKAKAVVTKLAPGSFSPKADGPST